MESILANLFSGAKEKRIKIGRNLHFSVDGIRNDGALSFLISLEV